MKKGTLIILHHDPYDHVVLGTFKVLKDFGWKSVTYQYCIKVGTPTPDFGDFVAWLRREKYIEKLPCKWISLGEDNTFWSNFTNKALDKWIRAEQAAAVQREADEYEEKKAQWKKDHPDNPNGYDKQFHHTGKFCKSDTDFTVDNRDPILWK